MVLKDEPTVILSGADLERRAKDIAKIAIAQCNEMDGRHATLLISATVLLAAAAIIVKIGQLDPGAMRALFDELVSSFEPAAETEEEEETDPAIKVMN